MIPVDKIQVQYGIMYVVLLLEPRGVSDARMGIDNEEVR